MNTNTILICNNNTRASYILQKQKKLSPKRAKNIFVVRVTARHVLLFYLFLPVSIAMFADRLLISVYKRPSAHHSPSIRDFVDFFPIFARHAFCASRDRRCAVVVEQTHSKNGVVGEVYRFYLKKKLFFFYLIPPPLRMTDVGFFVFA